MRLALALGFRSKWDLERTITVQEYQQWREFYILEPWGCDVEDSRTNVLATLIHCANFEEELPDGGFFNRDPRKRLKAKTRAASADQRFIMEQNLMNSFMMHNARQKKAES